MPDIETVPLVDVLDFREGPGIMAVDFCDQGVPLIRLAGLKAGADLLAGCNFLDPAKVQRKWSQFRVQRGDVLLSTSASLGEVAVVGDRGIGAVPYTGIIRFRPRNGRVAQEFIPFALQSPDFKQQIAEMGVGSVMKHFGPSHLKHMRLRLPTVRHQRAIAEVLGSLDDKIAANDSLIVTAEGLMRSVAASSADMTTVSQVAKQVTKQLKPDAFPIEVAHYSLPAFDDQARPELTTGGAIKSNKFLLDEPVVLMSKLNPRIPRLWNVPVLPSRMALASTEFVVLAPTGVGVSELWSSLAQPDVWTVLTGKAAGTSGSHQRVKPSEIMSLSIPDPRSLPTGRRDLLETLGLRCQVARVETVRLAATRDALLPGLMSGKIRVKDAERVVGEAV